MWRAVEALWRGREPSLVCKVSTLPADLAEFVDALGRTATASHLGWGLVAQADGVGLARLEGDEQALMSALEKLRAHIAQSTGSLVVLRCAPDMKARLDVWGPADALSLMRRIKERFDPHAILNPGRFVGGI